MHIVNSITSLIKAITDRYSDALKNSSGSTFKHIIGIMPEEPRPDGPELMFITEFATMLIRDPMDKQDDIKNREKFFFEFLRGPLSQHESTHKNIFSTFESISERLNNIGNILKDQQNARQLPELLNEYINHVLLQNDKVINLIYCCCKDSNKLFNLAKFMSEDADALTFRKHRIGHTLYSIFNELGFKYSTNTEKITMENVNKINRSILTKFSASEKDVYVINEIGVREFLKDNNEAIDYFKEHNHEKIYDDIVKLLKDIVSIYYHVKVIKSMQKSLPTLGIHTFLTNENTVSAIDTVIKITEKTFIRLRANANEFKDKHDLQLHEIKDKRLEIKESTKNPADGIAMFTEKNVPAEVFQECKTKILDNIKKYKINPQLLTHEKVTLLKHIFCTTLDCIQLQIEQNEKTENDYKTPKEILQKALNKLTLNHGHDEYNNSIGESNTTTQVSTIKTKNIEEICALMTKPNQVFALRDNVLTKHKFRSKLLEEIYKKIIIDKKWALHRWEWYSACFGTYNNKQFIRFYDIINTTIRTIENTPANQTELDILENIVKLYVQKSQTNFFRSPPKYTEKGNSISAKYNEDNTMSLGIADSSYQVPISLFSQEFVDILQGQKIKFIYESQANMNAEIRSKINERNKQMEVAQQLPKK